MDKFLNLCEIFKNATTGTKTTTMKVNLIITGATGMLGRSLMRQLSGNDGYKCIGTGFSRAEPPLKTLDLLNPTLVSQFMNDVKPNVVVHCAAERRPDVAANNPDKTRALNVESTKLLAEECARIGATLIYISTDYVFDGGVKSGVKCPYFPDSKTHPLSLYGETKLAAEEAVLSTPNIKAAIVRVPILYAMDCKDLAESAALLVAKSLLSKDTPYNKIDNWATRYFTSVDDVSAVLEKIIDASQRPKNPFNGGVRLHVSSPYPNTKYDLVKMMMKITGVDGSHLSADSDAPLGVERPQNTELNCDETWKVLGMEPFQFTPLYEGIEKALIPFKDSFEEVKEL